MYKIKTLSSESQLKQKARIEVWLPPEMAQAFKAHAVQKKVSMASIFQKLIQEYLDKEK